MVYVEKDIIKKRIQKEGIFNIRELCETTKKAITAEGFDFVEIEHSSKPGKYGRDIKIILCGGLDFDNFAKGRMEVEMIFEKIKDVKFDGKIMNGGVCKIKVSCLVNLDWKNKWGTSALKEFIFKNIYLRYIVEDQMKKKYFDVTGDKATKVFTKIKEGLDFYNV